MKLIHRFFIGILSAAALTACSLLSAYEETMHQDSSGRTYITVPGDPFGAREYTLQNGMKVYLSRNTAEPRIKVMVAVRAGSADEPETSTGLAHYFEHMMFKGNSKIASMNWQKEEPLLKQIEELFEQHRKEKDAKKRAEIYQKIDRLSAEAAQYANDEYWEMLRELGATGTNAFTSFDETCYFSDIPVSVLEKYLILEAERFNSIVLRRFHTELETVYEEYNMRQNSDSKQVLDQMLSLLMTQHPYRRPVIGNAQDLKAPSMRDIYTFFDLYYTPKNMALILCGDLDFDKTITLAEQTFGKIPLRAETAKLPSPRVEAKKAEPAIDKVRSAEVFGEEAELLYMAFRFDNTPENRLYLDMTSEILQNGFCGLIDKDLSLPRKVQSVSAGYWELRDYILFVISARPKQGQTLEQVRDLVLEEFAKLKKGEFADWLPGAVANNARSKLITIAENRDNAVYVFVDHFIQGQKLADSLNNIDKLEQLSKADISAFAAKNFADNYVIVYKRQGKRDKVLAPKQPVTPIKLAEEDSPYHKEFNKLPSGPEPEPVFVDYEKSLMKVPVGERTLYAVKNKDNERFRLSIVYPAGSLNDKKLALALSLVSYLGTDQKSAVQLKEELYQTASGIGAGSGYTDSSISFSGLQRNYKKALELFQDFRKNVKVDPQVLENHVAAILKAREDARKSPKAGFNAALTYAIYQGLDSYRNHELTEDELKKVTAEELTALLRGLAEYPYDIVYYGPEDGAEIAKDFQDAAAPAKKFADAVHYQIKPPAENTVYWISYPMMQTQVLLFFPDAVREEPPFTYAALYEDYTNNLFFLDLREKQGLAYSAGGWYAYPSILPDNCSGTYGIIGTQADKLTTAIDRILELQKTGPADSSNFAAVKMQTESSLRNSRSLPESWYSAWKNMQKMNYKENPDRIVWNELSGYDFAKFQADAKKYSAVDKPYVIVIIGDEKMFDRKKLEKYGKVRVLTPDDVFRR